MKEITVSTSEKTKPLCGQNKPECVTATPKRWQLYPWKKEYGNQRIMLHRKVHSQAEISQLAGLSMRAVNMPVQSHKEIKKTEL